MSNPKISVIVPVYNAQNTINRCIDSILSQTFTDFEVLFVNDGSKDESGRMCYDYAEKDSRVRVFNKSNGGVCSARNMGLENASGDWITFCDSDDWVGEDWLMIYSMGINQGVDVVIQGIDYSREGDRSRYSHVGTSYIGDVKNGLLEINKYKIVGYPVNKLFKRSIIRDNNLLFDTKFRTREDFDFVMRYMIYAKNMVCFEEGSYKYDMPDYSKKYINNDSFWCNCSIFQSINVVFANTRNPLFDWVYKDITNSLFDAYSRCLADCKIRLRRYLDVTVGSLWEPSLSVVTKAILATRWLPFIHYCFLLKSKVSHLKYKGGIQRFLM